MKKVMLSFMFLFCMSSVLAFSGAGAGTLVDPYVITNCTQLQEMEDALTSNYSLGNNVDCSETLTWNSGAGFDPVGNSGAPFVGTFSGENYNITDLYINRSAEDYVGLFGYAYENENSSGKFHDVGLIDVNISGDDSVGALVGRGNYILVNNSFSTGNVGSDRYVGGLIGYARYSNIRNCYSTVEIIAGGDVGGLAGDAGYSNISNCYAIGDITGYSNAGGLMGYVGYTVVNNCSAIGDVNGVSNSIGGLFGYGDYATVNESYATGDVNGRSYVGGLMGYAKYTVVNNCSAIGDVNGSDDIGGLLGYGDYATVDESYATGDVNGTGDVAGLVGDAYKTNASNCYATGNVYSLGNDAGGLLGEAGSSRANNCYATGNVNGVDYVGGLVGSGSTIINNSYATGNINGSDKVGGLAGNAHGVVNSYSVGEVAGNNYVGGLVGSKGNSNITNSYWNSNSDNPSWCWSNDTGNYSTGCTAVSDDETYFYDVSNVPMSSWDFVSVWDNVCNPGNFPVLQLQGLIVCESLLAEEVAETVESSSSSSGGSTPKLNMGEVDDVEFSGELRFGYQGNFKAKGENHRIYLRGIDRVNGVAQFDVYSELQKVEVGVGEEREVDLDGDGVGDVLLRLNSIVEGLVAVDLDVGEVVVGVVEVVDGVEGDVDVEEEESVVDVVGEVVEEKGSAWIWIVLVLIGLALWKRKGLKKLLKSS